MTARVSDTMPQDPAQCLQVPELHQPIEERVGGFLLVDEEERAEHRGERHRHQQSATDGEGVGVGHRAEESAFRARHREQRDERADDDRRRIEERSLDLARGIDDPVDERARAVDARAR